MLRAPALGTLALQGDKVLFRRVPEEETPVDDTGHAELIAQAFTFDACLSHGV